MWKRVTILTLSILLAIVVWVVLMAVAQFTYGGVATMSIFFVGLVLIPVGFRYFIIKLGKRAGSKKLDL